MEQSKIDRINDLSRTSKERPLTEEELQEQKELRQEYLQNVRQNLRAQIDNMVLLNEDGTHRHIQKKSDLN